VYRERAGAATTTGRRKVQWRGIRPRSQAGSYCHITLDSGERIMGRILLALLPALAQHGLRTVPELIWFQESASLHP
jgi:hypothetical protein